MPRLRRSDCSRQGFLRRRQGRGFRYFDDCGQPLTDPAVLARIQALVIPPAWTDVWICPWPNGHIQAIGTDSAGRRQYLYHPQWRAERDRAKHDRVLQFGATLPAARELVAEHLSQRGLTKERVLAAAFRLLDLGFFRIGSEEYAETNHSYGLATMQREHVTVSGDTVTFDFPAKSGRQRLQSLADEPVRRVIVALKRRRGGGDELLAYRVGDRWHDVRSADINDYVKAVTGEEFTAKDFRTWSATVLAAVGLAAARPAASAPTTAKRAVAQVVHDVARYLGNTPAVARASYIDPRVVDLYLDGITIVDDLDLLGAQPHGLATQSGIEAAVLSLLRGEQPRRRVTRASLRLAS